MFKNRNGYWMSPEWFVMYAPDDGTGGGADSGAENSEAAESGANEANNGDSENVEDFASEEIARLKAELAKQKASLDKATKEAGDAKKALRAKQSAEEIAAEEKKTQDEATKLELENLRKEVAMAKTVKTVMSRLGTDEAASTKIAEYMYGAEDAEAVLTEIAKAWTAREKALKLEYGRVPPPGAGGANGEDTEMANAIRFAKEMGQRKAQNAASVREQLGGLVR